jgi:hypothetical protein
MIGAAAYFRWRQAPSLPADSLAGLAADVHANLPLTEK